MTNLDIKKYASYFHDGMVFDIKHTDSQIEFFIESAGLDPEWNEDNVHLSKRNSLTGVLHLKNVKGIKINGQPYPKELILEYDEGNIYHLAIHKYGISLHVSWENYPPKPRIETDVFTIDIEAETIYWENLPKLFDKKWPQDHLNL